MWVLFNVSGARSSGNCAHLKWTGVSLNCVAVLLIHNRMVFRTAFRGNMICDYYKLIFTQLRARSFGVLSDHSSYFLRLYSKPSYYMYMTGCLYIHVHVYDRVSVLNKVVFACTSLEVSPYTEIGFGYYPGCYELHFSCLSHNAL